MEADLQVDHIRESWRQTVDNFAQLIAQHTVKALSWPWHCPVGAEQAEVQAASSPVADTDTVSGQSFVDYAYKSTKPGGIQVSVIAATGPTQGMFHDLMREQ